jgi:hypothetical protein
MTANTKIMLGVVWPDKHVAFPDFLDPTNVTNDWWSNEFRLYHNTVIVVIINIYLNGSLFSCLSMESGSVRLNLKMETIELEN